VASWPHARGLPYRGRSHLVRNGRRSARFRPAPRWDVTPARWHAALLAAAVLLMPGTAHADARGVVIKGAVPALVLVMASVHLLLARRPLGKVQRVVAGGLLLVGTLAGLTLALAGFYELAMMGAWFPEWAVIGWSFYLTAAVAGLWAWAAAIRRLSPDGSGQPSDARVAGGDAPQPAWRPWLALLLTAVFLSTGLLLKPRLSTFVAMDRCLDGGGRWDDAASRCEHGSVPHP
jgi:hypothetical protein